MSPLFSFLSFGLLDAGFMLGLLSRLFYCVAHIPVLAVGNSSGSDAHLT